MATISKLDVARRQLLAAIHIHWYLNEPLAVYTLATNAWEVSDALLKVSNKMRMIDQFANAFGRAAKDFRDMFNEPRNFMKHADRDPSALAPDLPVEECDAVLMVACIDYMVASGRSPYIVGLFVAWYAAIYPSKTGDFFRSEADLQFPDLVRLSSRKEQCAAARTAALNWGKSGLMSHPKNELTDNSRWTKLRQALS
ncbi:hypothetical protein NKK52_07035 [Mesorhizobium sp. C277A]|uniref:hypothetical protein n=1 Tax=unclassified Mesorhizobium TaxID=325217 RepID=UPI0003CE7024|nr:hypothetical protein [Mesorhizobium sp. LSJC277A00]ESW69210.1 hypothetical protein X771_08535 [Mesorhizobium sp. LSJC277A00]